MVGGISYIKVDTNFIWNAVKFETKAIDPGSVNFIR